MSKSKKPACEGLSFRTQSSKANIAQSRPAGTKKTHIVSSVPLLVPVHLRAAVRIHELRVKAKKTPLAIIVPKMPLKPPRSRR